MNEIITIGGLSLEFLHSRHDTGDRLDMFRMHVAPDANMPAAHYHDSWAETVYGLSGTMQWRRGNETFDLAPGESLYIERGVVHGFENRTQQPAVCLCVLTPGALGPEYFREIAALVNDGNGPPDRAALGAVMQRYGLIPVPG